LNDSLKKEYEEKNYLMLKVIIYLFLLEWRNFKNNRRYKSW
jgi:hypothetical protein